MLRLVRMVVSSFAAAVTELVVRRAALHGVSSFLVLDSRGIVDGHIDGLGRGLGLPRPAVTLGFRVDLSMTLYTLGPLKNFSIVRTSAGSCLTCGRSLAQ